MKSIEQTKPTFSWLVVIPGIDHYRMNTAKAIVHCYWDVYFKNISFQLGYESPVAQQCAFNCTDLHKTDMLLGTSFSYEVQLNPTIMDLKGLTIFICYWWNSVIANVRIKGKLT